MEALLSDLSGLSFATLAVESSPCRPGCGIVDGNAVLGGCRWGVSPQRPIETL